MLLGRRSDGLDVVGDGLQSLRGVPVHVYVLGKKRDRNGHLEPPDPVLFRETRLVSAASELTLDLPLACLCECSQPPR